MYKATNSWISAGEGAKLPHKVDTEFKIIQNIQAEILEAELHKPFIMQ